MPTPPPRRTTRQRTPAPNSDDRPTATDDAAANESNNKPIIIIVIVATLMVFLITLIFAGGLGIAVAMGLFSPDSGSTAGSSVSTPSANSGASDASSAKSDSEPPPASPRDSASAPEDPNGETTDAEDNDTGRSPDPGEGADGSAPSGSAYTIPGGEFFGISAEGKSFVYIVDCSGSMDGNPIRRAKQELIRSVESLLPEQSFFAIFFDDQHYAMYHPAVETGLIDATDDNKQKLNSWVSAFKSPQGGTDPTIALVNALRMRPDVIYLLTDGEFDSRIVQLVKNTNQAGCKINTVSFVNRDGEVLMKQIASQNGGNYLHVP